MAAAAPLQVAVGVIHNTHGQVLVALRKPDAHLGGLWEFPGGKIDAGESIAYALSRELHEELGIRVQQATPLITVQHDYAELQVQLHVWRVTDFTGDAHGREGQTVRWVALDDLPHLAFPVANVPIIAAARLPDFYTILDAETLFGSDTLSTEARSARLLNALNALLAQGQTLIQARCKTLTPTEIAQILAQALPLCKQHGAQLLLNAPHAEAYAGLTGVHLTSAALMQLTQRPQAYTWVAASCHSLVELQQAEKLGIDFVVLAPVQTTQTHPEAVALGWTQFSDLVQPCKVPVYALGGLTKSALSEAKDAGAQGIAGIRLFL